METMSQAERDQLQEDVVVFRDRFAGVLWQLNHLGDELLRVAYRRCKQESIVTRTARCTCQGGGRLTWNLHDGSHRRGRRSQKDRKRLSHRISLWQRCFQIDGNLVGLARESLLVHHQEVHALGRVRYHKDHITFLGTVALDYYGLIV